MVYDFSESPNGSSDDEEELITYTIYLRIYSNSIDLINYKDLVKYVLKKNGFKKIIIPQRVYDRELDIYQQALQYEITLEAGAFLDNSDSTI